MVVRSCPQVYLIFDSIVEHMVENRGTGEKRLVDSSKRGLVDWCFQAGRCMQRTNIRHFKGLKWIVYVSMICIRPQRYVSAELTITAYRDIVAP